MERILVINVNWLGDVLFSTPAIKALRKSNPNAYIACLVVKRCAEILENNPNIDELIIYDEYNKHKLIWQKFKFIKLLKHKKFTRVYILHQSFKRALIGYLSAIPERIGYNTKRRGCILTQAIDLPEKPVHKIDYFLYLLQKCGIQTQDRNCEFFIDVNNRKIAKKILQLNKVEKNDKFIVINPGGNWQLKRWPVENFALLADLLITRCEVKIIISGAKKDKELAEQIISKMTHKPLNLCGLTNLTQIAAIMQDSFCVVSADSGPMHISRAVGANTVCIFGPTSIELTGPVGKGKGVLLQKNIGCKIPCYQLDCP
ncbi:MAG: lipopolysaccharide heptosyltransferase II, partial [Candidatus Omnitrophota bacterium]